MRTTDYVDALRVKLAAPSDYALSKRLGIAPNVLARYRKGGTFDNSMAARAADILGCEPFEVIADMELERARTDAQRGYWAEVAQRFTRIAASVAGPALLAAHHASEFPLFILCKKTGPQTRV